MTNVLLTLGTGGNMAELVVIDTETTGFLKQDRIVEVSAVILDAESLHVLDEFDTLINPLRDVGPTHIHGIAAGMVSSAPTFEDVARQLIHVLNGRILVAHNLSFDNRMLSQEFDRLKFDHSLGRGLCTLKLTGASLASCCQKHGIDLSDHHRALSDARATAELLRRCDFEIGELEPVSIVVDDADWIPWTLRRDAVGGKSLALRRNSSHFLYPTSDPDYLSYLDTLDRYLDDLLITAEEQQSLRLLAATLGIDSSTVADLHWNYMDAYIQAAKRDGIISAGERKILESLASALEIPIEDIPDESELAAVKFFKPGSRVCFTGEVTVNGAALTRSKLESLAAKNGLQPVTTVTKKGCDLLVAADSATGSGKATKAREWGIPVISVSEFLEMLL